MIGSLNVPGVGWDNPILTGSGAGLHNSIFRGKNLGSSVTAAQWAAIGSGTFDDLWIGDYWVIGGVNWRIADFDYYFSSGDQGSGLLTHHAVIVPDAHLYTARMNATNTTEGGYLGSEMYTANLAQAKEKINAAFGANHILSHREYMVNATTNGHETGGIWINATVEIMTEQMVYGGLVFKTGASNGIDIYNRYTVSYKQLNLFRLRPDMIGNRYWFWLRDVAAVGYFAAVAHSDYAACNRASNSTGGVRPAFLICA